MEEKVDRALDRRDFSLLAGMALGGAAHVGMNAFVKRMAKAGTLPQRVGSAIFQKGVRDKAAKKVLHPAVQKISDALLGPEISHIYQVGLKSNRVTLKALAMLPEKVSGGFGGSMKGIVAGRRSPFTEKILNRLPSAPASRGVKKIDRLAGGAAAVGMGMIDPVLPAVNVLRSKLAGSKIGKNIMKRYARKGVEGKKTGGFVRALRDHLVSPSMGLAEDAGEYVRESAVTLKAEALRRAGEAGNR